MQRLQLHSKDEALNKFKVFKTEVELQQGSQIKRFRTDRGVPRPSLRIPNGIEDIGGSVVLEEVVTQQPEPKLRKGKRNRTPKDFRPEFKLYLIEGTRDEVSDQHSYCFNVEDVPKTFDEAMKSQGFKQKSKIDYFDTYAPVARISTIRLLIAMESIHNIIIHQIDVKTTFLNGDLDEEVYMNQHQGFIMPGNENKVDLTNKFLSSRFSMKVMREADVILGIRIKHESNGISITQSHYIEKVLKKFNYSDCTTVSTPLDTCEKLMPNKGLTASKKQICIIGSTMESKFVALAAAGKEVEWLKNLLLKITLWVKPMAPNSIRCDSAATLTKAYSQMYNGKSKPLSVRHSMICELITNVVVSIEFVRSQQNPSDHLTKGLTRDLIIKSAEGMGLKFDLTKEFLSSKFSMKDMGKADVILVSTPMDTSEKLMPNNGKTVSQLEYSRVIGSLMYAITCTSPDIAFAVGKLSSNTEEYSSTSGWVFLLGGATGKEAEWLKDLLFEIPLWSKPIAPISIRCDSVATLANAYSQMYYENSRHLGVRHSTIRKLITNESREDLLEDDIEVLRRSERFRIEEVIEMEENVIHI
nr:hypothetical protein [Tanacetum cinerariifolium]